MEGNFQEEGAEESHSATQVYCKYVNPYTQFLLQQSITCINTYEYPYLLLQNSYYWCELKFITFYPTV